MAEFELDTLAEEVEEDKLDELFGTGDGVNGVEGTAGEAGDAGEQGTAGVDGAAGETAVGTSGEAENTPNHNEDDAEAAGGEEASIFGGGQLPAKAIEASNEAPAASCNAHQQPSFDIQAAESALPPLVPLSTSPGIVKLPASEYSKRFVNWQLEHAVPYAPVSREHRLTACKLPDDVLRCIFDCIPSRAHLRRCQKVCKAFHTNSLPRMYRKLDVELPGEELADWHEGLVLDGHPGLRYVKKLYISPTEPKIRSPAALKWVTQLLEKLEPGMLERCWWQGSSQMPIALFELLWRTQPNLRCLELRKLNGPEDEASALDKFASRQGNPFPRFAELYIQPDIKDVACSGSHFLKRFNLTKLIVNASKWEENDVNNKGWKDSNDMDEDSLVACLFQHQHVLPGLRPRPSIKKCFRLKALELVDVNLRFCRQSWFAFQNLQNLTDLTISYCKHADIFITELRRTTPPGLEKFTLIHRLADGGADRTIIDLKDFLKICIKQNPQSKERKAGLRVLILHLRNLGLSAAVSAKSLGSAIKPHSETLRSLCVDLAYSQTLQQSAGYSNLIWAPRDLGKTLSGCKAIRELALAVLPYSWEYRPGLFMTKNMGLKTTISRLVYQLDLSVLVILNFPAEYKPGQDGLYHATVQPQLQRVATDLLNHMNSRTARLRPGARRLEVVAFGCREQGTTAPLPRYFVPGTLSYLHYSDIVAKPMSLRAIRRERMEGDLLFHSWLNFSTTRLNPDTKGHSFYLHNENELEGYNEPAAGEDDFSDEYDDEYPDDEDDGDEDENDI